MSEIISAKKQWGWLAFKSGINFVAAERAESVGHVWFESKTRRVCTLSWFLSLHATQPVVFLFSVRIYIYLLVHIL